MAAIVGKYRLSTVLVSAIALVLFGVIDRVNATHIDAGNVDREDLAWVRGPSKSQIDRSAIDRASTIDPPPITSPENPALSGQLTTIARAGVPAVAQQKSQLAEQAIRRDPIRARSDSLPSDDTLRQVMRTIATVHRGDKGSGEAHAIRAASELEQQELEYLGLAGTTEFASEMILDSEIAGAALRSVAVVKSTDGQFTVFSVFGIGDFLLESTPSARSLTISELSSGWSATLSGRGAPAYSEYAVNGGSESNGISEKPNYFRIAFNWVVDFLLNPLGLLLEMIIALIFVLWVAVKSVAHLQSRGSHNRR